MRFALLGSGRGSNAAAILSCWREGSLGQALPVGIVSDKPEAPILDLGPTHGLPADFIDPGPKRTRLTAEAEQRYAEHLISLGTEWVVLAGFMRVLHRDFLAAFPHRIINLHPSLLPSFKGLDAIGQALDYGVKVTGCTVHIVNGELDGGPILDQSTVRLEPGETAETLATKVHAAEHQLLPSVLRRLSNGELQVS